MVTLSSFLTARESVSSTVESVTATLVTALFLSLLVTSKAVVGGSDEESDSLKVRKIFLPSALVLAD